MTVSRDKLCCCFLLLLSSFSSAFFLQKSPRNKPKSNALLRELENLIEASQSGLDKSYDEKIKETMTEISQSRSGDQRELLSGRWELVYTTEKEINFFKTSWPFAKVSSITQKLDLAETQTVNNVIQFESGGKFAVTGNANGVDGDDEYDRVAFQFTNARAVVWGNEIQLPPVGTGWFDTMYCEDDLRLSCDSRGDWSVFRRIE